MKIAVPSADGTGLGSSISDHFGRSPYFTVYDTKSECIEIVPNTSPHHGPSSGTEGHGHEHGHKGHGYAFRSLSEKKVDALVCRGLGVRAMELFKEKGIKIFCGANGTVKDAIDAYQNGKLSEAGPQHACHHGHHH